MWGDQSKKEYNLFMIGICVLFSLVIVGVIIPIVEEIMTYLIVALIAVGAISWLFGRIEEAQEMHFSLHASLEELKERYPLDDYSE